MVKKLIVIMLAGMLIICMASCGSKEQTEEPAEEPEQTEEVTEEPAVEEEAPESRDLLGGWTINDQTSVVLPDDVQTAFDKAVADYTGTELTPVAYFGSQVVAGTNYAVLCRTTAGSENPVTTLKVAIIYADLQGNASLSYLNDFWLVDYVGGEEGDIQVYEEDLAGGWSVPEDFTKADLTDEEKDAIEKASETLMGNDLTPMACLGTQVVSGRNYAFMCHSKLTTEEPVESIQIVTVYVDTDGSVFVSNIATVNAADFNQ